MTTALSLPVQAGRALAALFLALAMLVAAPGAREAHALPGSFADLAESLSPAVVNISTAQNVGGPRPGLPAPDGETPFDELFRDFLERGPDAGPRTVQSLGSGFVVSADGYIVTNNHVIEDADEITINFADGRSLVAEVVGVDPKTDIAVLRVEPDEPLPFVTFGDSEAIRVGDWVLAIGNPFGLGGSVSAGIVSARNRNIDAGPYDDFLQTDAAINRGNSGGPLFNMEGQVIGVNTAIYSPTGGSVGVGFAVPSNIVANVVAQLREFGVTRRGWLGVRIQSIDDEMAEALGMDTAQGALVVEVTKDGPAEAAGLEVGDVILSFDGRDVDQMRDLPRMVAETPVDEVVRVTVLREGQTVTLRVTLGLLDEGAGAGPRPASAGPDPVPEAEELVLDRLGLSLLPLDDAARTQYGIDASVSGVLISAVTDGGHAAGKGLIAGDVVVEVGQNPVGSPEEVRTRIESARDAGRSSILFLVLSRGDLRFVPMPLDG